VQRNFGVFVLLVGLTAAGPVHAQGRDPAGAEVLYRAGREAARKGDWATACAKLGESQRLDPAPGTLLNLADCEEHRGQLATAWQHYLQAQSMLKSDSRAAFAEKRAAALEKRVPKLVVRLADGAPQETRIVRDDQELGPASLGMALPLDPGDHVIITTLAGRAEGRTYVTLGEGETRDVAVGPGAPLGGAPPLPPTASPTPSPAAPAVPAPHEHYVTTERTSDRRPVLGWLGIGLGALAVGGGAVAGVLAFQRADTVKQKCGPSYATCDADAVDAAHEGKTFTLVSTIGFAAGAALTAAGLYFLLTPGPSKTVARVGPGFVQGTF
jgi:hypothetical protein